MKSLSRSRRSVRKHLQRRNSRRLLLESLEPRQMMASVPVAQPDPIYSTAVNTDLTVSTSAAGIVNNDFDADGNSLSASVVANPANGSLIAFNSSGTFTYRPNNGFSGIDTFTYKVNDGSNDSNIATVTVAVGGNFGPRTNLDEVPANAMLMTGALTLAQPLSLGHSLVYRSDTVDPHPIVVLETSLLASSSVPDSIDATLTFNGSAQSTVSYTNTGVAAGDPLRFVLKASTPTLATGYYDWSIELKAWFGSNSYTRTYTGSQAVVNRSTSEYGKGWWLDGLDQLYANSAGALLVQGSGDTLYFKSDGSGGYLKAPGDTSFSTLVKNGDNTFTLTTKYGDKLNFGTTGLLTSRVDTNDNTIDYTYTSGKLTLLEDPFDRDTTLTYTSGQLTSFQDLASRTTTLAHTSGKLTSVTHPDPDAGGALAAPVTEYQYDATTSLLTIRTDALDYDTTYAYDGTSRRLTSINHPNSTGWSLTAQQTIGLATGSGNTVLDPAGAIGTYTDERSKTWSFKTDRFGNVTYFMDPLNNVTTTERDANGLPIRLTEMDPDGAGSATSPVTKFGYSSTGNLVRQYLPDGNDLEWTYNGLSRVLTQTNQLNYTWEFTYDADGNMTAAEDPLGNTTTYEVNSRGQVTETTTPDPDGAGGLAASTTEFAYNSSTGTLTTITNPGSSTRTFTYNAADLQLTMTDELSHVWSTGYDNLNRVTSETKPDPDGGGSLTAAVTSYNYNANSWLIETIDALSNDTDYTYNSRGWVTQVQRPDPDGAGSLSRLTSTYVYNDVGQLTGQTEPEFQGGVSIGHTYDDAGRLTSLAAPIIGRSTEYTLDNLGRVTKESAYVESDEYNYVKYAYNSRGWVTSATPSLATELVDGPASTFTYDAAGQLLSETNGLGYSTSYNYDARGLVTKVTLPDPDGESAGLASPITTYVYDNAGRNTSVTDARGRVTTLAYDSRNRLTTVTAPDPDGAGGASSPVTTYAYDNASRRTSITDPLSRVTSYGYDNANRLLTITLPDPDGGGSATSPVTTYAYNKMDSVTSVTDPMGNVTTIAYDNLQRRTTVTQADPDSGGSQTSPVTTFTYNAQGLLAEITDPLSHDTTFGYDNVGRRTTVTNHEGQATTTVYDDLSRVISVTTPDPDAGGGQTASVTAYEYDAWSRLTEITDPRDGETVFAYDVLGQLTSLRDASYNETSWTYDGLGRVTLETNELDKTRTFAYDAVNNLIRKTDRNARTTRYTYDNLDRLTEEKWITGGTVPTASSITTTQGGPHNEVQRVGYSSQAFLSGTFTLTFAGQTTAAINHMASAADVRTALENLSNIDPGDITVTKTQEQEWQVAFGGSKAGTNVSQITIDVTGLIPEPTAIQETDTQGSASNAEVQTVTINNATGGTFRLTFGVEQTADLACNASAATVETALDGLAGIDNVAVTGNAGGPYTITFGGTQSNTNVPQISADVTFLTSGTVDRTLSYAYDAASQLTSTSDPDSSYAYTFDNLGRVLTVSNSGTSGVPTVVLTSAYNANGQRTSVSATRGGTNDFLNSYTYDNLGRLTRLDQAGNGGATVANKRVDFTYNALGQFATIARQAKPSSTWNEVATSTYTYDTLNRLTALDHKKGSTDIANYDWTYDAMNRVTQFSGPDGTSDYTYDKESQLTATDHSFQSDESYTYDATGNRTNGSYSVGTNNRMTSDGTYNFTYDDEGNRLTRTRISDSSLTEYTWDHRNRLTKVVERASGAGQPITKQTDYKYDVFDRRISKSVDADGAGGGSGIVSRFVYFADNIALQFDGSNNLTHRYLHGPAVDQILADENASNSILWPLTDNLGTVRDLVNDAGAIQNHLKYDSFGQITAESNAAVDHIYAFTGRDRDDETSFYYYRARYYDAVNAKFISQDLLGFAAGDTNLSRYVGNNGVNWIDPFGLQQMDDGTSRTVLEPPVVIIQTTNGPVRVPLYPVTPYPNNLPSGTQRLPIAKKQERPERPTLADILTGNVDLTLPLGGKMTVDYGVDVGMKKGEDFNLKDIDFKDLEFAPEAKIGVSFPWPLGPGGKPGGIKTKRENVFIPEGYEQPPRNPRPSPGQIIDVIEILVNPPPPAPQPPPRRTPLPQGPPIYGPPERLPIPQRESRLESHFSRHREKPFG